VRILSAGLLAMAVVGAMHASPALPQRLSETGLYVGADFSRLAAGTRPFAPQYPLWSDGAKKTRWVQLPPGATIDATDVDAWELPVGTRFWKEFSFGGRKVETRLLWRSSEHGWTFGSYVWNQSQTDAELAPADGLPGLVEVAPGKRHSIPSIEDCRACHENGRVEALGFTALQLSTDRDPNAPNAEPLPEGALTLQTLVDSHSFVPPRPEFVARPPRIPGDAPTRAALGYLSANCGACHNDRSELATVRYPLRLPAYATDAQVRETIGTLAGRTTKWDIPHSVPGTSRFVTAGAPDLSALLVRMRSRRPSSQMPPLGTVVPDREAIDLVSEWIKGL
jgi:hypothetical protein